jgi:penicillin-binding protein 2
MKWWFVFVGAVAACSSSGEGDARRRVPERCDCVVREVSLPAARGEIVDRNGVPFTATRPAYGVYAVPATLDRAALIRALALTAEETAQVDARIAARGVGDRHRSIEVLEDVTWARAQALRNAALAGVEVRDERMRTYPQRYRAAHAIGYLTPMTTEETDRLLPLGYQPGERVGRYGIESRWEPFLRGKAGVERTVVDASGQPVDDPAVVARVLRGDRRIEPIAGDRVVLTIDARLQRIAETAVASAPAAAVVVVEVGSGKVLALV